MRAAFYTLGCKVNQYETQVMTNQFANDGFDIVTFEDEAEIYVINSCTVTEEGDKKVRRLIRRVKQRNPQAAIALTGCFPQAFPEKADLLSELAVVQGAHCRYELLKNVKSFLRNGERIVSIKPHESNEAFEPMKTEKFDEHTRAFVKIEDGCDRYCSYCIIPKARGPVRSKPLDALRDELSALAENGYREIVLVGINLSSYGKECGYIFRLPDAVEAACQTKGIERVRLGSLEPELLTDQDLDKMAAQDKFCPQFHLSVQSGCDETLKRMNRHYTSAEYLDIVRRIEKRFKNAAITTDIMVGFAGETEAEFEASLQFAKTTGFARIHVFSYSIRAGTAAAAMPNQPTGEQKKLRCEAMLKIAREAQSKFLKANCGNTHEVLTESRLADGSLCGYTKNYIKTLFKGGDELIGNIVRLTLTDAKEDYCLGEL